MIDNLDILPTLSTFDFVFFHVFFLGGRGEESREALHPPVRPHQMAGNAVQYAGTELVRLRERHNQGRPASHDSGKNWAAPRGGPQRDEHRCPSHWRCQTVEITSRHAQKGQVLGRMEREDDRLVQDSRRG